MIRSRPPRPPRDWQAIHAALGRPAAIRTPAQIRELMDARARKLAARPALALTDQLALARFELAGERYAIELAWVHEVVRLTDYAPVPGTPPWIVGLTCVRSDIVAVIDLRALFGLAAAGLTDQSRLVLIGDGEIEFGFLVDRALGTVELAMASVLPASAGVTASAGACVRGVTTDATIVLDGKALLFDPRLVIDQTEGM